MGRMIGRTVFLTKLRTMRPVGLGLLAGIFLSGCAGLPQLPELGLRDAARGLPEGVTGAVLDATTPEPGPITALRQYTFGEGDEIEIRLRGATDPIGIVTVLGTGRVRLPLVGERYIVGETTEDLEGVLSRARELETGDPTAVEVHLRNPWDVYILGEVKNAGRLAYARGLTLGDALAARGGPTHKTDPARISIRARHAQREMTARFDPALPLLPGDIIRLNEQFF